MHYLRTHQGTSRPTSTTYARHGLRGRYHVPFSVIVIVSCPSVAVRGVGATAQLCSSAVARSNVHGRARTRTSWQRTSGTHPGPTAVCIGATVYWWCGGRGRGQVVQGCVTIVTSTLSTA